VPALNNVSFLIRPGEYVAFVGRSGAGKSSTIHLIERFFDPTAGQVFLDGHDIRTEAVQTHRARLALVVSTILTKSRYLPYHLVMILEPSQIALDIIQSILQR
jgi:ABC-type multidrug transport system fused ATPase/permease subunit